VATDSAPEAGAATRSIQAAGRRATEASFRTTQPAKPGRKSSARSVSRNDSNINCRTAISVSTTVSRYLHKRPRTPSQTWRTYLANHLGQIAFIDELV